MTQEKPWWYRHLTHHSPNPDLEWTRILVEEATRRGIQQGKREAWADVKKHLDETSADLSGSCYEPGLDLASRMVEEKLSSLDNPSKG